jgi:hypothetical protein
MTSVTSATIGPWHSRVSKINQLQQSRGYKRTLYAILRRILRHPATHGRVGFYAGDFWQLDLESMTLAQTGPATRVPRSYQVRMADENDLPALAAYYGNEQTVRERRKRGDLCFLTLCQDHIGAAVWLVLGPGEFREDWVEMHSFVRFPAGTAWSYDGKGTKGGAGGVLMKQLPELVRALGTRRIATLIDSNNWQSHDAHRSLGYEKTGLICSADLLGLRMNACRQRTGDWKLLPTHVGTVEARTV